MWAHPGKKLIFQGGEFGQLEGVGHTTAASTGTCCKMGGTTACAGWSNTSTGSTAHEPALYELDDSYEGFEWIDFNDADNSVISFARKSRGGDVLLFVVNATPVVRENPTASARRGRVSTRKSSTPTPRPTAAATWATAAGWKRRPKNFGRAVALARIAPAAAERGRLQTAAKQPENRVQMLPNCYRQ